MVSTLSQGYFSQTLKTFLKNLFFFFLRIFFILIVKLKIFQMTSFRPKIYGTKQVATSDLDLNV